MRPRTSWIVLGLILIAAMTAQAGTIYKWTDADGVVHYSDQPHPGATEVQTSGSLQTYSSAAASGNRNAPPTPPKKTGEGSYQILALSAPTAEQSFFGDEPVSAALALSPNLKEGHTVTWRLNGAPLADQSPTATQISISGLSRGQYSVSATVNDPSTGQSWSTDGVTFYVRQPSELSPLAHHH